MLQSTTIGAFYWLRIDRLKRFRVRVRIQLRQIPLETLVLNLSQQANKNQYVANHHEILLSH